MIVLVILAVLIGILFIPLGEEEDFNCFEASIYQDINYLGLYTFFLLNYAGVDLNDVGNVLDSFTFEINSCGITESMDMMYTEEAQNLQNIFNGEVFVYNVSLVTVKEINSKFYGLLPPNKEVINMDWLVSIKENKTKILNAVILENQ